MSTTTAGLKGNATEAGKTDIAFKPRLLTTAELNERKQRKELLTALALKKAASKGADKQHIADAPANQSTAAVEPSPALSADKKQSADNESLAAATSKQKVGVEDSSSPASKAVVKSSVKG